MVRPANGTSFEIATPCTEVLGTPAIEAGPKVVEFCVLMPS